MLKDVGIYTEGLEPAPYTQKQPTIDMNSTRPAQYTTKKQYSMIVQNQGKFWMILGSNEILTKPPATSADLVYSVTSLSGHLFNQDHLVIVATPICRVPNTAKVYFMTSLDFRSQEVARFYCSSSTQWLISGQNLESRLGIRNLILNFVGFGILYRIFAGVGPLVQNVARKRTTNMSSK